jgi:transposase InsO family protein
VASGNEVALYFLLPCKPTVNPFIEPFNRSFRNKCLRIHGLLSLDDAREKIEVWRLHYNDFQLHTALDNMAQTEGIKNILKRRIFLLMRVQLLVGGQSTGFFVFWLVQFYGGN